MKKRHSMLVIFGVLALWLMGISVAVYQYKVLEQQSAYIHSLDKQVKSFQRVLSTPAPIRTEQIDYLESTLHAMHATRVDIAQSMKQGLTDVDLTQLLYMTERFTDRAESFISAQVHIHALVHRIDEANHTPSQPAQVQVLYYELGAFLLNVFYSEQTANPVNYLTLESILLRSNELPAPFGEQLRQILAQASVVLAEHAQLQYLGGELSNHLVSQELSKIEHLQYTVRNWLFYIVIGISGLTLLSFVFLHTWLMPVGEETGLSSSKKAPCRPQDTATVSSAQESLVNDTPLGQESDLLPIHFAQTVDTPVNGANIISDASQNTAHSELSFDVEYMLDTFEQDLESVIMVLNVFLDDHRNDVEKIRQQFPDDPVGALRTAHSIKGVAGNLGASSLKQVAQDVEQSLNSATELPQPLLQRLDKELSVVAEQVERYLNEQI